MDISLTKLSYLVTVARTRNFSRAAELLHVSQPALSRSISAIEHDYGVKIFERSRTGAVPTVAGAQIIDEAADLLRNANTFHHNLRMMSLGERGKVSIGMGPAIAATLLARLSGTMMERHSGINLLATIRPTNVLVTYLMTEAIELFVSPPEHVDLPGDVETREIGTIQGGFYVRAGHPLSGRKDVTIEEIMQYPLTTARQTTLPELVARNAGTFVCDNYAVVFDLLRESNAVCITARRSIAKEVEAGEMTMLKPSDLELQPSPVVVATIRGRSMSPMASEIVEFCREWLAGPQ